MTRGSRLTRRRVLGAVAAGAAGGLAGCSFLDGGDETDTPTGPDDVEVTRDPATGADARVPPDLREAYDAVVNVVDAGADNTGESPVDDVIAAEVAADTLLYFPRGEYHLSESLSFDEVSNLGLVGDRALIRPPKGFVGSLLVFGTDAAASGLRFEGIDFDLTAENTGARPIHAAVDDDLLVRDVAVLGRQDVDHDCMRFDVTGEDGTGRIENLRLPDGGVTDHPITGIYVGEDSVGELTLQDCQVFDFPDNALYASPAEGPVRVIGGHYANSGISNVRVSGDGLVSGVRVTCNTAREGLENMRGIRLRGGRDVRVEDCRIEMLQVTESDGAITLAQWLRSATIRNTTIRTVADRVPAVLAKSPQWSGADASDAPDGDDVIEIENVTATGTAADEATVHVSERDQCRFRNLCVHQQGANRNGVVLSDSQGHELTDCVLQVTGDPLVLENATADRSGVTTGAASADGGCR